MRQWKKLEKRLLNLEKKKMNNEENEKVFEYDNHEIRSDWDSLKEIIGEIEPDMDRVLQLKGVNASVRVRNKLSDIKKLVFRIRQGIQMQKQDNNSGY